MPFVFGCVTVELPSAHQKDLLFDHAPRHSYAAQAQHSSNTSACREAEQCRNIQHYNIQQH